MIKDSTIKITLRSKSGFSSNVETQISVKQWADINRVIEGKLEHFDWVKVEDGLPNNMEWVEIYSTWSGIVNCRFSDRNQTYGTNFKEPWFCKSGSQQYSKKYITHWRRKQVSKPPTNL